MRGTLRVAVLGTAAAALLGSGLISAFADSATSSNNYIETTAYTEDGEGHDLKVAILPFQDGETEQCTDESLVYSDNVGPAAFNSPIYLDEEGAATGQGIDDYCLRNDGSSPGEVWVSFTNPYQSELACTNAEASADPSCGFDEGEIAQALTSGAAIKWQGSCVAEGSELATSSSFEGLYQPQPTTITLAPGEVCRVFFVFYVDSDPTLRRAAQTDGLQWDIVWTLQDPSPAP